MSAVQEGPLPGEPVELQGGRYAQHSRSRRSATQREHSPFVPLLILLLALASWAAFQWINLSNEAQALEVARAVQDAQFQQAQRVRQALDTLATETRKLAEAGNSNARQVLEELRKRGVAINAPAQSPTGK